MPKYKVRIFQVVGVNVEVDAPTKAEACQAAFEQKDWYAQFRNPQGDSQEYGEETVCYNVLEIGNSEDDGTWFLDGTHKRSISRMGSIHLKKGARSILEEDQSETVDW